MSQVLHNIEVPLEETLEEHLAWLQPDHGPFRILRESVDARKTPVFVYSVEVARKGESLPEQEIRLEKVPRSPATRPIVVGSGPAGLFCALRLVERGIPCILLERGSEAPKRMLAINKYWRYGDLNPDDNVCFGEGGAGLYSDGKLITRIKSPHIPYVMDRLVQFGAPAEIRYLANPHVGSDRIRRVIPKLRDFLKQNGCEVHFNTPMAELLMSGGQVSGVRTPRGEFLSDRVILAPGHSATDLIYRLADQGVHMEPKSFALGLRIEHPQKLINKIQYKQHAEHPRLGAANYRLADHDAKTQVGVYSFCMCPGGYVLSATTDSGTVVCNGMSNYNRNSPFANAAVVVSVDHKKWWNSTTLGGMEFRRALEARAFEVTRQLDAMGRKIPAQPLTDFMVGRSPQATLPSSTPSGVTPVALHEVLPQEITSRLRDSLNTFDRKMRGFLSEEAQLHGIESRTSCPIRMTRDKDTYQSLSTPGLYPAGEGAGYAGGITSAAVDGVRIADRIAQDLGLSATEAHS